MCSTVLMSASSEEYSEDHCHLVGDIIQNNATEFPKCNIL